MSPICLPWNVNDPGRQLRARDNVTVTGWGRDTNIREESSEVSTIKNRLGHQKDKLEYFYYDFRTMQSFQ